MAHMETTKMNNHMGKKNAVLVWKLGFSRLYKDYKEGRDSGVYETYKLHSGL